MWMGTSAQAFSTNGLLHGFKGAAIDRFSMLKNARLGRP